MSETPRRFIAGAQCPSCGEMDKLVLYYRDGIKIHECVRCGYRKSELAAPALDADQHADETKVLKSRPQVIQWFKPEGK